jgi:hypothetical protein
MQNQIIHISVIANRPDQLQEKVDAGVSGEYEVAIPLAEAVGLNLADVALESFHSSIAIASPEDFEIQVFDQATGAELTPVYGAVETLFACKRTDAKPIRH